jgi:ketosteroid isomerase-like protein
MEAKTEVLSTIEAMTCAFNRGDIDAIMHTYESGAVVLGEPGAPVRGDAPLRAMFAGFIAAKAHFSFDDHEVIASDDIALHLTPWQMTGVAPDGTPITGEGLSLAVLRRQPDGRWLMVIDNPFGDAILQRALSTRARKNVAR